MSGSGWVTIPSWLSVSLRFFFVQFCAFLSSLRHVFCFYEVLYCAHIWMKYSFDISNFLEEISSLSPSVCCYFFASFIEEGLPVSLCYSLELCIQLVCRVFFSFSPLLFISFLFSLFVKPLQTTALPSCISFSLGWFCSLPSVQYYEPMSIVLQVLCLLDLIPWIYSSHPLYIIGDLI